MVEINYWFMYDPKYDIDISKIVYGETIAEWKTKSIIKVVIDGDVDPRFVIMRNNDGITAWDGARKDSYVGKGADTTTITSIIMENLNDTGIKTHFIKKLNDTDILVEKCDMIPLEVIYRFINTWSYHKRQKLKAKKEWSEPMKDWESLPFPVYELNYKNTVITRDGKVIEDPLIEIDYEWGIILDNDWNLVLQNPATGDLLDYVEVRKPWDKWKPLIEKKDWVVNANFSFNSIYSDEKTFSHMLLTDNLTWNDMDVTSLCYKIEWWFKIINIDDIDVKLSEWVFPELYSSSLGRVLDPEKIFFWYELWEELNNEEVKQQIDIFNYFAEYISINTEKIFNVLDLLYEAMGIMVFDWKIEFWVNHEWDLILADVIDGESCRLREVLILQDKNWKYWLYNSYSGSNKDVVVKKLNSMISEDESLRKLLEEEGISYESLDVINEISYLSWFRVVYGIWLDKQWFREGESVNAVQKKYWRLAYLLTLTNRIFDLSRVYSEQSDKLFNTLSLPNFYEVIVNSKILQEYVRRVWESGSKDVLGKLLSWEKLNISIRYGNDLRLEFIDITWKSLFRPDLEDYPTWKVEGDVSSNSETISFNQIDLAVSEAITIFNKKHKCNISLSDCVLEIS